MKFAVILALAVCLAAQDSNFNVKSNLVLVPTLVTDAKGRSVDGLEASDFRVLDNGKAQKAIVDTMATGVAPIALVIAVQSSGISIPVLQKVQKIGSMVQPVITGERGCAALVTFAENITWLQECTSDQAEFESALDHLKAGEEKQGRMLDAVSEAITRLRSRPNARRVLLLISESRDRGSEAKLDAVTVAAQSAGVTVYAATYSAFRTTFTAKNPNVLPAKPKSPSKPADPQKTIDGSPPSRVNPPLPPAEQRTDLLAGITELARLGKENATQVLTTATGGATFPFTRLKGLEDAIEKLGAELHSEYVLSFTPDAPSTGYHRLEVRVPEKSELRVKARPGYWSTTDAP